MQKIRSRCPTSGEQANNKNTKDLQKKSEKAQDKVQELKAKFDCFRHKALYWKKHVESSNRDEVAVLSDEALLTEQLLQDEI